MPKCCCMILYMMIYIILCHSDNFLAEGLSGCSLVYIPPRPYTSSFAICGIYWVWLLLLLFIKIPQIHSLITVSCVPSKILHLI
ncbi:hypothetical protein Hanom_Chr10g00908171 [Helianthus anomalus]